MNTLVRSTTASLSRRFDGYEPLDRCRGTAAAAARLDEIRTHQHYFSRSSRAFPKRKKTDHNILHQSHAANGMHNKTRSYRAKQRRIFLKSYQLATAEKLHRRRRSKSQKLKNTAAKVVKAVVSVMSFLRIGSGRLRSCDCRLAIRASSPTPVHKM